MTPETTIKLMREGKYVAEISVTLIDDDNEWSPRLSAGDVQMLDAVRLALRRGDLRAASPLATVYAHAPVAAE
ncbi:MAG TPA: hypothetical protein PK264_16165 [Hyphomicrobiaceae bacterium]|nr:hypothetical protein [Hyphomicrobiaceae bacterium]